MTVRTLHALPIKLTPLPPLWSPIFVSLASGLQLQAPWPTIRTLQVTAQVTQNMPFRRMH